MPGSSNPLLFRDPIGKARKSAYDLPDDQHVYGRMQFCDPDDCVAVVLRRWRVTNGDTHLDQQARRKGLRDKRHTLPSHSDPEFVYGRPIRPSTPVSHVMASFPEEIMENDSVTAVPVPVVKKLRYHIPSWNKAHPKYRERNITVPGQIKSIFDADPRTLFKLRKFEKVGHKVDDRWSSPPRTTETLKP